MTEPFIEQDCTIEFQEKRFESGGAWILPCTDGRMRGVVYVDTERSRVTTWHGDTIASADFGDIYQGPFCRMQSVRFYFDGILFFGRYCPDWSQAVRVRSSVAQRGKHESV